MDCPKCQERYLPVVHHDEEMWAECPLHGRVEMTEEQKVYYRALIHP
jgi:hypothetical protein